MRRHLATALVFFACAGPIGNANAADFTVDPAQITNAYMNVFNLPVPAGDGAFQFGTGWGFADLTGSYTGSNLTLGPNVIGDPNVYWYQCVGAAVPPNCGGPGAPGNKIMEANSYAQVDNALAGETVTFSGEVLANSLTSAHKVYAFVKDFAPDFSSFIANQVELPASGPFSVSLNTVNAGGRHVQWGFQMVGVNVWVTDVAPFGTVTVGPSASTPTRRATWGSLKTIYR